jgi:hypothetical protein
MGGWLDDYRDYDPLPDAEQRDILPPPPAPVGALAKQAEILACPACGSVSVHPIRGAAHRPTKTWACRSCDEQWVLPADMGQVRVYLR